MTTNAKKYLLLLLGLIFGGMALIAAGNWLIDPFQYYRKASYPPLLLEQKRFQYPGLARNYDYNTVIIGTSLSENFHRKSAQEKLGYNMLNLAMEGASAREQRLMLEVALRTGRVKNVIWEINYESFRGSTNWVANYDGSFPEYFYDENPWNKISHYLLNLDAAKDSLKVLLLKTGLHRYHSPNPETLYTWDTREKFGRAEVARVWQRSVENRDHYLSEHPVADFAAARLNTNFEVNALAVIRAHPEVKFYVFFPAFSLGRYAFMDLVDPSIFDQMTANRRHIFDATRGLANVELFDFQGLPIIRDPDQYCDLVHYNGAFNDYMLDSFREKRHLLAGTNQLADLKLVVNEATIAEWKKSLPPARIDQ